MEKHYCFITDGYPYGENNHCVFVRELVAQLVKEGIRCSVISPVIWRIGKKIKVPKHYVDKVDENNEVNVYRPRFIHLSSKPVLMGLSSLFHTLSVCRVIKREGLRPDAIYGHFIYHNGLSAVKTAKKYGCKSFIACGENTHRLEKGSIPYSVGLKWHGWRKKLKHVSGMICVSGVNRDMLLSNGFIDENTKMCVIPNAVDTKTFCVTDKKEAREKLGFPENEFIAVFVGAFCDRKGNLRVDEALAEDKDVRTVFIGKGAGFTPKSNCLFCGSVKHDELPLYLNAADVFVLPTTGEGCCNAIIEAVCCGLPVVSSEESFNDDILDDSYSIRINSMNVMQIRDAVSKLKNDRTLLEKMHNNAIEASEKFSIEERARKILRFINDKG